MNETVDFYEQIKKMAENIGALYTMGFVINISGIGTPTVLLTTSGFDILFPLGSDSEVITNENGEVWEKREAEVDGVRWVSWERTDA